MPTVNELYKAHEQLKRDGKNEEAIASLEELPFDFDLSRLGAIRHSRIARHEMLQLDRLCGLGDEDLYPHGFAEQVFRKTKVEMARSRIFALAAASFFLVHPVQTESVGR